MAKIITAHTRDYHASLLEGLSNKDEAIAYLNVALEEYEQDNDNVSFMMALRNVAEAQGGLSALAQKTDLNRSNLYKALSGKGNPKLLTLDVVLRAMGFRLAIEAA